MFLCIFEAAMLSTYTATYLVTHAEHHLHGGESFHYARMKSFVIFARIVFKNSCEQPKARISSIIPQIVRIVHQD
jgi:hypothetical protein